MKTERVRLTIFGGERTGAERRLSPRSVRRPRYHVAAMRRLSRREFESVVREALDDLPEEFAKALRNVAIVVDEEPDEEDYELTCHGEEEDDELLGIFRGMPLTDRSFMTNDEPCVIALFRGPISRVCESVEEMRSEIRDTVIHELGHYFGLTDDEMPY